MLQLSLKMTQQTDGSSFSQSYSYKQLNTLTVLCGFFKQAMPTKRCTDKAENITNLADFARFLVFFTVLSL